MNHPMLAKFAITYTVFPDHNKRVDTHYSDDPVEAAVRAVQARRPKCPTCGPRPESDATYCSGCGHYLPGACGSCGTAVELPGARFCNSCGAQLAA
jgi:hypothetical protein